MISGTLNKNIDYFKHIQQNTNEKFAKTEYGFERVNDNNGLSSFGISKFKNLIKDLIACLESKDIKVLDYYELKDNLNKESIELLWNEMESRDDNKNK